jgi:hypothetical protein
MNPKQTAIFEVINAIVKINDVRQLMQLSEIRYGFLNYVAKYSLARDKYFVTPRSLSHLKKHGFIKNSELRRGLKSQKNGFTYEHPVPVNVIGDQILLNHDSPKKIAKILEWTDTVFVLTTGEDNLLVKRLANSMPTGWRFFKDDVLARYLEVGITEAGIDHLEINVTGAVAR